MLVRKVSARLKPNSLEKFALLMEHEILPWLREQEGFLDLITLSVPGSMEVATLTFWDHQDDVPASSADNYPAALKLLQVLLDGAPYVKTFEVVNSTFHRSAAEQMRRDNLVLEDSSEQVDYRTL